MTLPPLTPRIVSWLLLIGLSFFFGLAFEEFHARAHQKRPGGIRSFPLLAIIGGLLYQIDPSPPWLLGVGFLGLNAWLGLYYWHGMAEVQPDGLPNVGLMAPICNSLAFLIGPVAITGPPWLAIGVTVAGVLLLTARETLHRLAQRIELAEIVNAGRFLLLTGLVLPLLPDRPVTSLTTITPYQVWLAMVAVSTVSYGSYLLRRYVVPNGSGLLVAFLGGIYSSTVTTIVLARRARTNPETRREAQSGIVLANAVMYLRLLIVIALFDRAMALALAPWMAGLALAGAAIALGWYWYDARVASPAPPIEPVANPLGIGTALTFATLFVVVSILAAFVMRRFGSGGVYSLAGIIGVTDINPFVLSLAQHSIGAIPTSVRAAAVLIATSSNNVFQSAYASAYSGGKTGIPPVAGLLVLAAGGLAAAYHLATLTGHP